eukprot:5478887-Amphidinium_carterae.1
MRALVTLGLVMDFKRRDRTRNRYGRFAAVELTTVQKSWDPSELGRADPSTGPGSQSLVSNGELWTAQK